MSAINAKHIYLYFNELLVKYRVVLPT